MQRLPQPITARNDVPSFAEHFGTLPWPAQRIRLRHGLTAAAALVTAREAGYALNGGDQ